MTDTSDVDPAFGEWSWEFHEKAQRRRYARLPLAAKIAWLEEAQRMVLFMKQQRSGAHDRLNEYDSKD